MSNTKILQSLEERRKQVIDNLVNLFPIFPGSYGKVFRKCGKINCWCGQSDQGHPLKRITWTEDGKSYSKTVSDESLEEVLKAINNYKKTGSLKQELAEIEYMIHDQIESILKQHIEISRISSQNE